MSQIKERHSRNIGAVTEEEMMKIYSSRVLVVGCGGLGGNNIEQLARMGVGFLRVVDGDTFAESNLNRQILSSSGNIGYSKAAAAKERVHSIDPDIEVEAVCEFFTEENAATLMADVDLVIDALDNVESRLLLEDCAAKAGLYIVHGAIRAWDLQVMLVPPGSGLLHSLYTIPQEKTVSPSLPMTPAACASLQSAVAVRFLTGYASPLEGRLLISSISDMSLDIIEL